MRFLTYLIISTLLCGCGELSYKTGGTPQDIERAHRACRGSGEELNACLAKQGWQKPQVDQLDPLFATVRVTETGQEQSSKPSPIIEVAPKTAPQASAPAVVKTPQKPVATPSSTVETKKPPKIEPEKIMEPEKSKIAVPTPSQSTVNDGPDVEYVINSWWKMGAFPDKLKQDQLSCERKLGAAYLPNYKTQTYKRAFVVCMHDAGWMAVRNVK